MKKLTLIISTLILISGNLFSQTFTRITTGDIVSDGGNGLGVLWADYDNDSDLDLLVTNQGEQNFLYENNGDGNQCMQVAMRCVLKHFLDKDFSLDELDSLTGRKENL